METTTEEPEDLAARAVEEELEKLGITADYRVSLEWESTADLDIFLVYKYNDTRGNHKETISYEKTTSDDGTITLDVDNRGAEHGTHVENISFNGTQGTCVIYVNNHDSNDDHNEIPFSVVTKLGEAGETFHDSWNINEMGAGEHTLGEQMMITTINL